jgi:cytochrome P450
MTDASQALLLPFDPTDFLAPARRNAISDLNKIIQGIIRERRASNKPRADLLDMLLHVDSEGRPMSDAQVRDEVMTLRHAISTGGGGVLSPATGRRFANFLPGHAFF